MNIRITCDGAASNNGRPNVRAGGGAVVELPNAFHLIRISHETVEAKSSQYGYGVTNNTAELISLGMALNHLGALKLENPKLEIYMDSSYAVGLLQKEGATKAKANVGLVEALRSQLSKYDYSITHEYGHVGSKFNEMADALANEGKDKPDNVVVLPKEGGAF